ncbi:MAG: RNA methyltransferase [Deltaproteobacteria bacterium]|nr:RNA methyltransferase [Deltaproteobacteria bacterium]MBW1846090.1 RNA methyltransferase [Deltaproteobacteria bacterium]MBW1985146.1 RNA methyltransferase [Deltaproteobacteria bacterium]MBW2179961.1 RNA methyltransferase [Deltaproteobacteria bacterium]
MRDIINLENITIVLKQPRYPENIGAAARSIRNMGIGKLVVLNPENYDVEKILKLATHEAADIVKRIEICSDVKTALAPFNYVAGTTARLGGQRQAVISPPILAENLIPISKENQIAILFGPEDRGLSNEDLRYCHALVNIPTAEFSSINLAQAVMIMSYELFKASIQGESKSMPRLATRHELDGMYDQLKEILVRIDYINHENPDYWMNRLRQFFTRMQLRAREVSIIRGICRQMNWYSGKCYEDGLKAKGNKK